MTSSSEELLCPTTSWYKNRRRGMVAMLLGFSLYFCYDWKIGYPEKRLKYDAYWPEYQRLVVGEKDDKTWLTKAKDNGWPASPKEEDWDYKIREQLIWAIGTGAVGIGLLVAYLRNKDRFMKADGSSLTTPVGARVPFVSVRRIDKRKWDNKGLAYLTYQDGDAMKKAVIDDFIYEGAGKVLDRLLEQFQGELIDLEREPAAAAKPAAGAETAAGAEVAADAEVAGAEVAAGVETAAGAEPGVAVEPAPADPGKP